MWVRSYTSVPACARVHAHAHVHLNALACWQSVHLETRARGVRTSWRSPTAATSTEDLCCGTCSSFANTTMTTRLQEEQVSTAATPVTSPKPLNCEFPLQLSLSNSSPQACRLLAYEVPVRIYCCQLRIPRPSTPSLHPPNQLVLKLF